MSKLHFLFIFYIFSVLFKMYQVITGKSSYQKLGTLSVHFGTILGTFGKMNSKFVFSFTLDEKHCNHCHWKSSHIWKMSWARYLLQVYWQEKSVQSLGMQYLANPKFNLTKIFWMQQEIFLCARKYFVIMTNISYGVKIGSEILHSNLATNFLMS